MKNEICQTCGLPAGHGYIIESDHFDRDFEISILNPLFKTFRAGFTIYKVTDGKCYICSVDCMEILERTGIDLCDDIPIDEPLVEVKVTDGKCQYCKAREMQLNLF